MTYDAQEISVAGAHPVFLYAFARTGATTVRLTASEQNESYGGNTYVASEVEHDAIRSAQQIEREELELRFARTDTSLDEFRNVSPYRTTVTISRAHRTDGTDEVRLVYKGIVVGARVDGEMLIFRCLSIRADLSRASLHNKAIRTCRWVHFGDACGLPLAANQTSYTVSSVSGRTVTLTTTPTPPTDLVFNAGLLEYNGEHRTIEQVSGNDVIMLDAFPELEIAASSGSVNVNLSHGCRLNPTDCNTQGNILNYGGFPYFPDLELHDGRSVV